MPDHLNTVRDIAKYDPGTDMTPVVNHLVYDAVFDAFRETPSRRRKPAVRRGAGIVRGSPLADARGSGKHLHCGPLVRRRNARSTRTG